MFGTSDEGAPEIINKDRGSWMDFLSSAKDLILKRFLLEEELKSAKEIAVEEEKLRIAQTRAGLRDSGIGDTFIQRNLPWILAGSAATIYLLTRESRRPRGTRRK